MNKPYMLSSLLSATCHIALVIGLPFVVHQPNIYFEQSPSALELCLVTAEAEKDVVNKNDSSLTKEEQHAPEYAVQIKKPDSGKDHSEERKEEKEKFRDQTTSCTGNATFIHNVQKGVEHINEEPYYIHSPAPHYPVSSRKKGEEGMVVLDVSITKEGTVGSVELYTSSGFERLDRAAITTVHEWQFKPALFNGKPIAVKRKIPILFKLQ